MTARDTDFRPALPNIAIGEGGEPRLMALHCRACSTTLCDTRLACPACGERAAIEVVALGRAGRVHAHTVVHRSFPGVPTPFVAVVVDLDGGGTVKGTLADVDPLAPPPERVEMRFRDSGQRTREGQAFLSYVFIPEGSAA